MQILNIYPKKIKESLHVLRGLYVYINIYIYMTIIIL